MYPLLLNSNESTHIYEEIMGTNLGYVSSYMEVRFLNIFKIVLNICLKYV